MCLDKSRDNENPIETTTINECSKKCIGITSHFAYGTNEFGGQGCQAGLCKCYCIRAMESLDESCQQLDQKDYWFLRFKPGVTFDADG